GGKDSALAALLLSRDYHVELSTFVFRPDRKVPGVEGAARSLGYPWKKRVLPHGLLDEAVKRVIDCGYPNEAITMVHRCALQSLAAEYAVVADGTRFDDRVPKLTRDQVQSLQDTLGCSYIRPLLGFPRREVDRLAGRHLQILSGETGNLRNGDYESEIREEIAARGCRLEDYFPPGHEQSLVLSRIRRPEDDVDE
ncbi:MAG: alpha hydrolase, partial [Methanolinea sp.]|nr:alpha hydrolase [Methanolinea sp.]